jgi:chromosome segregation ATPase
LQRSLQVSGELFLQNKELEEEKEDLKSFGVLESARILEQEEQLQQQQQQIQQLQQQLQQERSEKEAAQQEVVRLRREREHTNTINSNLIRNYDRINAERNELNQELYRAQSQVRRLELFIEESIRSLP